ETLRYLEFTGRPTERLELVEAYTHEQGLFHDEDSEDATYSETLELDLSDVEPSLAGPKRPQDRVLLSEAAASFAEALAALDDGKPDEKGGPKPGVPAQEQAAGESFPASDPPTTEPDWAADGGHVPPNEVETVVVEHQDCAQVEMDGEKFPLGDGYVV